MYHKGSNTPKPSKPTKPVVKPNDDDGGSNPTTGPGKPKP